jgi:hypothetical protein
MGMDIELAGRDFRKIQLFSRGIAALRKSGRIEVVNLETEAILFKGEEVKLGPGELDQKAFDTFVDDVVALEEFYGVSLSWPSSFEDDDFRSLELLQCLKDNRPFAGVFTFTTIATKKDSEQENAGILQSLDAATSEIGFPICSSGEHRLHRDSVLQPGFAQNGRGALTVRVARGRVGPPVAEMQSRGASSLGQGMSVNSGRPGLLFATGKNSADLRPPIESRHAAQRSPNHQSKTAPSPPYTADCKTSC